MDSFRNKSGKPQPIRTNVGTHAQVNGRQRSRNFGCDQLSGGEMGGLKSVPDAGFFFCTFRQLRNVRFSPDLAMIRESWLKRRFWTEIYEKYPFRGHLPPKPQTLRGVKQVPHSEQATGQEMHCRYYLLHIVAQGPGSFQGLVNFFCTTYQCFIQAHRGGISPQNFEFFPPKNLRRGLLLCECNTCKLRPTECSKLTK